jgi:hypothetical protein
MDRHSQIMLRFALALLLFPALSVPSMAQLYQGNWSCRDASTNRAGILTIYGSVYGWASRTTGDVNPPLIAKTRPKRRKKLANSIRILFPAKTGGLNFPSVCAF